MNIIYKDIVLRATEEKDMELLREMMNDPDLEHMTGGYSYPVSFFQQQKWFQNRVDNPNELRLIIETEDMGAIGAAMLTDIDWKNSTAAYHLKLTSKKDIRGKGYGTKATKAMIKYAFEQLNINCITTNNMEYNTAIEKLKERCGFVKEGVLRNRVFKNGKYHNTHIWSLLNNGEFND